jgi:hypothetical protein
VHSVLLAKLKSEVCCVVTNSDRFKSSLSAKEIQLRDTQLTTRYLVTAPSTGLSWKQLHHNNWARGKVTFEIAARIQTLQRPFTRYKLTGLECKEVDWICAYVCRIFLWCCNCWKRNWVLFCSINSPRHVSLVF